MKRSWLVVVAVSALGMLAGVAIAGRPTTVDDTVITPVPTTTVATATTLTTDPATGEAPTTTTSTDIPSTTSTEPVDRSVVRVLVSNGTNRAGFGGATAVALVAAGFTTARAVPATAVLSVTVVFARAGFEAAAQQVALELGLAATVVAPLPDVSVTPEDASADVIVAIGDDFPLAEA